MVIMHLFGQSVAVTGRNPYRGEVADVQQRAVTDQVAEHLRRGELLDLAPDLTLGSRLDEEVMRSWDGTRSIAAEDLRDVLRGRLVTDPDPRGLPCALSASAVD
jgi:hypothetical protein